MPVSRQGSTFFSGIPSHLPADAQTGDESDRAVDREHLAMVAGEPRQRRVETRRVVAAHLDAAGAQAIPEAARSAADAAQPVVDETYAHAGLRLADERVSEPRARRVVVEDIVLEMNVVGGRADRFDPGRVVLASVPQQPDAVAFDQGRARCARERLIGKLTHRRHAGYLTQKACDLNLRIERYSNRT
jgi:hypothetical protein